MIRVDLPDDLADLLLNLVQRRLSVYVDDRAELEAIAAAIRRGQLIAALPAARPKP